MQQAATAGARTTRWEAIGASTIGTIVEWYDFYLYGTAAALVLNKVFFPNYDPLVGILASYATFAVGYLVRPFGGVLFGHFGDKYGRKPVLITTLLLMGFGTAAIGLLPTYGAIGIAAPILLLLLRLVQGLGAGAEYAGAVLFAAEYGSSRRGFFAQPWHTVCHRPRHCTFRRRVLPVRPDAGGSVYRLGLAGAVPAQPCCGWHRVFHAATHPRDAGIQQCKGPGLEDPCARLGTDQRSSGSRAGGDGEQRGAVHRLRLHRLCARLHDPPARGFAGHGAHRADDCRPLRQRRLCALRTALGCDRTPCHHDYRLAVRGAVRVSLLPGCSRPAIPS